MIKRLVLQGEDQAIEVGCQWRGCGEVSEINYSYTKGGVPEIFTVTFEKKRKFCFPLSAIEHYEEK